jgi:hypothetical protein
VYRAAGSDVYGFSGKVGSFVLCMWMDIDISRYLNGVLCSAYVWVYVCAMCFRSNIHICRITKIYTVCV